MKKKIFRLFSILCISLLSITIPKRNHMQVHAISNRSTNKKDVVKKTFFLSSSSFFVKTNIDSLIHTVKTYIKMEEYVKTRSVSPNPAVPSNLVYNGNIRKLSNFPPALPIIVHAELDNKFLYFNSIDNRS